MFHIFIPLEHVKIYPTKFISYFSDLNLNFYVLWNKYLNISKPVSKKRKE
jgi:hypothetical protein